MSTDNTLAESISSFGIPLGMPVDLVARVEYLEDIIFNLQDKIAALEAWQEDRARDIAYDRQRIMKLEQIEPQPLQKDRGEILRALLAANNGKMLAKEARQKMHLTENRFSELVSSMKGDIEIKKYHLRKNQKVLVLK